jgi:hypothetical protein
MSLAACWMWMSAARVAYEIEVHLMRIVIKFANVWRSMMSLEALIYNYMFVVWKLKSYL